VNRVALLLLLLLLLLSPYLGDLRENSVSVGGPEDRGRRYKTWIEYWPNNDHSGGSCGYILCAPICVRASTTAWRRDPLTQNFRKAICYKLKSLGQHVLLKSVGPVDRLSFAAELLSRPPLPYSSAPLLFLAHALFSAGLSLFHPPPTIPRARHPFFFFSYDALRQNGIMTIRHSRDFCLRTRAENAAACYHSGDGGRLRRARTDYPSGLESAISSLSFE